MPRLSWNTPGPGTTWRSMTLLGFASVLHDFPAEDAVT
jgi:hypothetical protein